MKKFIIPLFFIASFFMASCINDFEPKDKNKDKTREIRLEVSYETGITYGWPDDKKEHPIECMLVKMPDDQDRWQPMMFGEIEGFTYERGHEYCLSVRRTTLANPPADASCYTYSLIKILSDRIIAEPEVPIDKDVASINDIEYQELCPFNKYAIESLYYVNCDGIISYSDGRQAPSYNNARIYTEIVLPMEDPNWLTFQHIPYQATYSYICSPLSDMVRLVRNESSGPMFKNVIPEEEFNYIVENLKENEELRYTIVLANVYKLGLQKLSFNIKKR